MAKSPEAVTMLGRRVRLRPLEPDDTPFLYDLATDEALGFRWRYRGAVPDYETFARQLWSDVLVQLVIEDAGTGVSIGLAVCYGADLRNRFAYIAVVVDTSALGSAMGIEAVAVFVRWVRMTYDFRKLYAEFPEFNEPQFRGSGRIAKYVEEGRFTDHIYHAGRYWDFVTVSINLDMELVTRWLSRGGKS